MSTSFIGTVLPVGFDFAPAGWAFCNGQTLPINQYQALYALIGSTYGGDDKSTFRLPDLRGRTIVGASSSAVPSVPTLALGKQTGANGALVTNIGIANVTIGVANLPPLTISGTVDASKLSATSTLNATKSGPGTASPNNGPLPMLSNSGSGPTSGNIYYVNPAPATPLATLALSSASVVTTVSGTASVTLGSGTPIQVPVATQAYINLMQPSLGVNYIICLIGIYPTPS